MKTRFVTVFAVVLVCTLATWQLGLQPRAEANGGAFVAAVVAIPALGGDEAAYVGANKCKKCHLPQSKSWKDGKKAKAIEVLLPGNAAETKAKHNLDVNKDYSKDETCLPCHTTGFGHPGGYAVPAEGDEAAAKAAPKMAGVGCESCHGPGGAYLDLHDEIMKSKRTYKAEEMHAGGMNKIEDALCITCHNDKSPTFDAANPFDFAKMKDQGGHDHFELKQRE